MKVTEWTRTNTLSLNIDKTFAMVYSNSFIDLEICRLVQFDDQNIKFLDKGKFLGLHNDT